MSRLAPEEAGFFAGDAAALAIYRALKDAVTRNGPVDIRVAKSQIGFYRAHPLAAVWRPGRYLAGERPPLVLSLFLRRRDSSPHWKEIVEPSPGRFTHHAELGNPAEVETFVDALAEAWRQSA